MEKEVDRVAKSKSGKSEKPKQSKKTEKPETPQEEKSYGAWYEEFQDFIGMFEDDALFGTLDSLLQSSANTFACNKKLMEKAIDVSWVEAIENGMSHLDAVLRNPRKTIEDVEEVVPIALSRKITVESVKHLAQHTDLIQSIDEKTGKITPSKILNVYKEESWMTYENKFVNTLVDRLYIFIHRRYEKLAQVAKDEEVYSLGYDTAIDTGGGGKLKLSLKLETTDSLDAYDANGMTIWQRVEKLKTAIEGYKGSELCQKLGTTYIRPPVMRTNAIMKNVDLKACLTLWQFIESYDKVGYEINVQNTAVKPQEAYIEDFYKIVVLNFLLFRSYMNGGKEMEVLKTQKSRSMAPKFVKRFDKELSSDYNIQTDAVAGYVAADGDFKITKKMPPDVSEMFDQIAQVIAIEKNYLAEAEKAREAQRLAEEEAERHRQEMQRIEEARRAELERIAKEKEEEEKRIQEMLEKKRAEQEAEERERQRLEAERLARLEEQRKREEEERLRREEEERQAAERARIAEEKNLVLSELGDAEGVEAKKDLTEEELEAKAYEEVTEAEIAEVRAELEEEEEAEGKSEFEDPRAIAARKKLEAEREEKERRERERAARLKVERQYFESKPFEEIRREYSWNPFWAFLRLVRWVLAMVFHVFPQDTDNPDFKMLKAELEEKKRIKEAEREEHDRMEQFYHKYAQTYYYRFLRWIDDQKFKRKKRKAAKGKPKPVYNPPNRTPEQEQEIRKEMQRLYKEYHVSVFERITRWFDEEAMRLREAKQNREKERQAREERLAAKAQEDAARLAETPDNTKTGRRSGLSRVLNIVLTVVLVAMIGFVGYVMFCTMRGKAVDVFGKSILQVVTGSMEPSLHTGDIIVIERVETADLQEGDIISYYSKQEDILGMLVTHRIKAVNADGSFVTMGDANPVPDALDVQPEQIVGRYTGKARFLIWLGSFADVRKLLLLAVMIVVSISAIYELRTVMRVGREAAAEHEERKAERREEKMREAVAQEIERLRAEGLTPEELGGSHDAGKTDEAEDGHGDHSV